MQWHDGPTVFQKPLTAWSCTRGYGRHRVSQHLVSPVVINPSLKKITHPQDVDDSSNGPRDRNR